MIFTDYGLPDVLVSSKCLTYEQVLLIRETDSSEGRVRHLLQEITEKTLFEGKKKAFLSSLDKTNQKHVSNYVRGKGVRAAECS